MQKFNCRCGRAVRDIFYKNGEYSCGKCFWQGSESIFDYIINILAEKGLVITYKNEPVLILKQFSADFLDKVADIVQPNETWIRISGDDFWQHYTGHPEQLRNYITSYGAKDGDSCSLKEE